MIFTAPHSGAMRFFHGIVLDCLNSAMDEVDEIEMMFLKGHVSPKSDVASSDDDISY